MMNPTDAAYIAGVVDGEGYIGLIHERSKALASGSRYVPRMSVGSTTEALVDHLVAVTGAIKSKVKVTPDRRPAFMASWESRKIRVLLPEILPYLIVKRPQAEEMLRYLSRYGYRGSKPLSPEDLLDKQGSYQRFCAMNMRGGRAPIPQKGAARVA